LEGFGEDIVDKRDTKTLRVSEINAELRQRDLPLHGTREEKILRLEKALIRDQPDNYLPSKSDNQSQSIKTPTWLKKKQTLPSAWRDIAQTVPLKDPTWMKEKKPSNRNKQ